MSADVSVDEAAPTILVVEDDHELREAMLDLMRAEGYRARGVPDADSARRTYDEARPALMLVDLDGNDVEALARQTRCPMILVSTRMNLHAVASSLGVPLVPAPFDVDVLLDHVVRALAHPYERGSER